MNTVLIATIAAAASAASSPADPAGMEPMTSVDALVEAALQNHPDIQAAERRIDVLEHAIPQAWVVPDPVVASEYSNMPVLTPWPGNHPMSGIQLKLSQKTPFPTKFFARAKSAEAARDAAKPPREETKNMLTSRVRKLAVAWQTTRALREVNVRHIEATERLLDAVRVKFEVGRVEQYELLRLEVLRDRLKDDLDELDRQRDRISADLNALAQRPPGAPIDLGNTVEIRPLTQENVDDLVEEARSSRPLLQAMTAAAKAQRLKASAFRAEKWPDLTTWVGYRVRLPSGNDPGNNFVTAGVSLPLPWSSAPWKWEEKAQARESQARVVESERASVELSLQGEIEAEQVRYARAMERAKVYQEKLIPGANETLDAAFAAYQVDRAGFAELFAAEVTALDFERVVVRAQAEAAQSVIQIETLVGRYANASEKEEAQ